ncbi:unnamed protein product, partial [Cuscuta campestris]
MVNNMDHGLPKFSLLGYDDWKIMMEAHLYALHDCMWMVLEDGPLKIQMENPERNPAAPDVVQYIQKPKEKWDDRDRKKHNLDNVAKAAIFKTLDPITFSKIKHPKTAMEIWQEKNVRLLRSLPTEWYTKATAMEEGRNLENYTVQGLLDERRIYEHELKKKKEEQVTPFPTALMTTPRIPSSEGTCTRNCDTPSSSQPTSSKMENYDEEFAMMVKQFRKFKKFFKKADSIRRPSKGKPQFKKMMKDFEEINLKHSSLTEENKLLSEENLKLTESQKSQLNEITQLKTENESLSEKKLEAKCSSPTFYQSYLEMIAAQELSEFLHMEIRFKYENEVLEFYKNGKVKTVKSKKDPQRTIQVINSTVGGTKVKLSQKKLGEKLHLPNSGVEIGRLPAKNLDW